MQFTRFGTTVEGLGLEHFPQLPKSSQDYFIEYGMRQSQADAGAGAKNAAEWTALISKRIQKAIDGTIATRGGGTRDPFESTCIKVARETVTAHLDRKGLKVTKTAFDKLVNDYRTGPGKNKVEAEAKKRLAALSKEDAAMEALMEEAGLTEVTADDIGADEDEAAETESETATE